MVRIAISVEAFEAIARAWRPNYQAAGFSQNALYLLRPDTYIALADKSASSEALSRYFADRGLRL